MPFIILDRDGVINYESNEYIKSPEEWIPIPGSLEAIAQLNRFGYSVLVASNQSGIARGLYDLKTLDLIHEKFLAALQSVGGSIAEIFFCPHHPDEKCPCRKPSPGMLHQIARKYPVNLQETFFIGDSLGDIEAAKSAGCRPLLVLTGKGQGVLEKYPDLCLIPHFDNLATAVEYVLFRCKKSQEYA